MSEKFVHIRPSHREDCSEIMRLIQELATFEKAGEEVTISLEAFEEDGFGPSPVYTCYVAEAGTKIVGFALYYIRFSTWKGQRLYLEDLLVTQSERGRGIGKKLFRACLEDADKKGVNGMVWQVLNWNQPAIDFYDGYGATRDPHWINCALEKDQIAAFLGGKVDQPGSDESV